MTTVLNIGERDRERERSKQKVYTRKNCLALWFLKIKKQQYKENSWHQTIHVWN